MALFLISLIPYLVFTIFKTKKSFHMLQQNFYNDDNRYFKWVLVNIPKMAFDSDILFVLLVYLSLLILDIWNVLLLLYLFFHQMVER